jgi:hypothetical protein
VTGTTFQQIRDIHQTVKKIVTRVCKEMDAGNMDYREYRTITRAVVPDPEMLALVEDPANYEALIGAYLDGLVWDAACGTGDWANIADHDQQQHRAAES